MDEITILQQGISDSMDLLSNQEMDFVLGGTEGAIIKCKEDYEINDTTTKCNCGYEFTDDTGDSGNIDPEG